MQYLNLYFTKVTGKAQRLSEGHFPEFKYRFKAASRTRFLIPHFILTPLFAFPPAGDVDKIVLPEGMQTVNFSFCKGLTGTAEVLE